MYEQAILRPTLSLSLLLTAALFFLPLLGISGTAALPMVSVEPPAVSAPQSAPAPAPMPETPAPIILPAEEDSPDEGRTLRVLRGKEAVTMTLAEYLRGVVRAEMPASFHPEALKAQAVAARTYTLYKLAGGGGHDGADICTDPACCQAWTAEDAARENWGSMAEDYETKIRAAVSETDGQTMFYGGKPILAAFHASSSGLTRLAGQVWQSDLPYLRPASSPEQGENIPNYYSRAVFSAAEFRTAVLAACPEADLSGDLHLWLQNAVTDGAGNVDTLEVGGVRMRGSRLRGILGLRSACFDWAVEGGQLVFYVTGHGHGVGMSQYGANAMANGGADWQEILRHYYADISIHSFTP